MKVKFYGVRGSIPAPGRDTAWYGGNTTCIEVSPTKSLASHPNGRLEYILDAGSGIRVLGNDIMRNSAGKPDSTPIKVFLTHDHWDHIQGFPFFVPAYVPGYKIEVYSGDRKIKNKIESQNSNSDTTIRRKETTRRKTRVMGNSPEANHTKDVIAGQQDVSKGYFPVGIEAMRSDIVFHDIKRNEAVLQPDDYGNILVENMIHKAHPGGMISYALTEAGRKMVFTGDFEHDGADATHFGENDEKMISFARGASLFIADGQYTPAEYASKKGWGHSSIERICHIAVAANVGELCITHHDPMHNDEQLALMEKQTQGYMQGNLHSNIQVSFAREGLELVV